MAGIVAESKILKVLLNNIKNVTTDKFRNHHPILNLAQMKCGVACMRSPNELSLMVDTGTDLNGFLDVSMYGKTGNINASMASYSYTTEDYPKSVYPENATEKVELEPEIFGCNFQQFAKYAADDPTRACLNGVHFNPALNEVIAIDGHILLAKKLEAEIAVPFIVAPHSFKILDMIAPYIEEAHIAKVQKEIEVLHVSGEGFSFVSKLLEGPYPEYNKVIPKPDRERSVTLSPDAVNKMISGLTALLPFSNKTTHLVIFENDEMFVYNRDTQKHMRVKIRERIFSEKVLYSGKSARYIGFNIEYLLCVLKDAFTGKPMTIYYSPSVNGAMTIQTEKQRSVIMPLRVMGWEDNDSYSVIPPEYIEVEPAKAPRKQTAKIDKAVEVEVLRLQANIGKAALLETLRML